MMKETTKEELEQVKSWAESILYSIEDGELLDVTKVVWLAKFSIRAANKELNRMKLMEELD